MAVAELAGSRIIVHSEFRERELITKVPGGRWNKDDRNWSFPLSWATCVQLRGVFAEELQIGPGLNAWAKNELDTRVLPTLELREAHDAPEFSFFTALFPYQRAGVRFLIAAGSALCADEMGLGKTIQTIATLEATGDYPALIVCPNSVKDVWANEFKKWAPHREVLVISGGAAGRRKQLDAIKNGDAHVAVMNWEQLRAHSRLAGYGYIKLTDKEKEPKELQEIPFKTVVADEAHRAKDPSAKQTRALWATGWAPTVKRRYMLTGTPVANSPVDLWSLMHFIAPDEWPSKVKFVDRYAIQSWNTFGFMEPTGIKGEMKDEFFKILDPRFIRRLKKAVLSDPTQAGYIPDKLPPITRMSTMTGQQKKAYQQLRDNMIAELDSGVIMATSPLTRLTRLRQFASAYGELSDQLWMVCYTAAKDDAIVDVPVQTNFTSYEDAYAFWQGTQTFDGKQTTIKPQSRQLTLTEPSCKVDTLMEIDEELGGQQAVIFAESRQLIELAANRLQTTGRRIGMVTGAISPALRTAAVADFQAGNLQYILVTLGAGGEGLTLTAASVGIFLQRSYSLVKNAQAEDRLHRPGQHAAVQIVNIVTEDTVDEKVHEVEFEKRGRMEDIVRDEQALRNWIG